METSTNAKISDISIIYFVGYVLVFGNIWFLRISLWIMSNEHVYSFEI